MDRRVRVTNRKQYQLEAPDFLRMDGIVADIRHLKQEKEEKEAAALKKAQLGWRAQHRPATPLRGSAETTDREHGGEGGGGGGEGGRDGTTGEDSGAGGGEGGSGEKEEPAGLGTDDHAADSRQWSGKSKEQDIGLTKMKMGGLGGHHHHHHGHHHHAVVEFQDVSHLLRRPWRGVHHVVVQEQEPHQSGAAL